MKNVITTLFLFVSCAIFAQDLVNITYVSVARENSEEFLELHKKFTNMSMGEERTIIQSAVFAHAFAGDYTFPWTWGECLKKWNPEFCCWLLIFG